MQSSYDECLNRVLAHEGGYTNDPRDPGGPTNWGITIWDARLYWKKNATAADVRAMPLSVAKDIYKAKYWDALRCDLLPAGVDDSVFDYGVNSGIGRAGKVLRQVVGLPAGNWHVTDEVLAVVSKNEPRALILAINDERLAFLKGLRTWSAFGVGWGRRVAEVRAYSLQLAKAAIIPLPPPPAPKVEPAPGKTPDHPAQPKLVGCQYCHRYVGMPCTATVINKSDPVCVNAPRVQMPTQKVDVGGLWAWIKSWFHK
jgi:lysozyme family protein